MELKKYQAMLKATIEATGTNQNTVGIPFINKLDLIMYKSIIDFSFNTSQI
ncbi:hypothetical protein HMPREF6485_1999 [Segatella buccae ATCC 33574]|uniref:Uncharacterized protein n=1 Tax=Segatella buccae ATCC 33574 TaxID=873513 RepID=E6K8R3_9BACT|nr:hypothetical protein HMPREF6485_1999 [Segatella buccae ATCC 33574]